MWAKSLANSVRASTPLTAHTMKVAIEGCCHGELDNIYASIQQAEKHGNFKTDVLLLCGDMQALRNRADLECLAVPQKYRQMGDFHKYYSGEKTAPVLTLVIGGNHEASNYMFELYHGGWLAPNIYFLGEAGVVNVGGLIVAGASGIYKSHDYTCGRFERMPLGNREIRSIYHTRVYDIWRLKLMQSTSMSKPDIVMSHDWPNTIEQHGDTKWLINKKPFFKSEINSSTLGSPPLLELLDTLQPKYWFSAHLHVKFAALYKHGQRQKVKVDAVEPSATTNNDPDALDVNLDDLDSESGAAGQENPDEIAIDDDDEPVPADNPDEINIDDDDTDEEPPGGCSHEHAHSERPSSILQSSSESANATRFLSLSKCLPNHDFLQFIDVPTASQERTVDGRPTFRYSPRWLAILRATNHLLSLHRTQPQLPPVTDLALQERIATEETWVKQNLIDVDVPQDGHHPLDIERIQQFIPTAAPTNTPLGCKRNPPLQWFTNPQTESLTSWLQIENKINRPEHSNPPAPAPSQPVMRFLPQQPPPRPQNQLTEDEEVRRIEAAAQRATEARKRAKVQHHLPVDQEPLRLDDDDELNARWKEGTG